MQQFLLLLCMIIATNGDFYSKKDAVVNLTPNSFDSKVLKSSGIWFIEFYAPWCGHCKNLTPEWKKAAETMKGIVHFGAVDADKHQSLGGQYGVKGFPTIKIFGDKKTSPTDYQGQRSAQGLIDAALSQVRQVTKARSGSPPKSEKKKKKTKAGSVVVLTDSNFNENVMQSNDVWMVEFYAPWCGHCKNLAPEWKQAAKELKGSGVKVAEVDATAHTAIASEYGIKGFPTIKYFMPGAKSPSDALDYQGERKASAIVDFSLQQVEKAGGNVAPVVELSSHPILSEHCFDNSICIVVFLPHILDSMKKGREEYLTMVSQTASKFRGKPFRFGWVQAGDQSKWESILELTFGFPCLVALNFSKQRYAIQRGSFTSLAIKKFLNGITSGSEKTFPLPDGFPDLESTTPWDGQEGVLPQDEDEDADIMAELLKDEL